MTSRAVRRWLPPAALAAALSVLAGCDVLGLGTTPGASGSASAASPGPTWSVYVQGKVKPSPTPPAYVPTTAPATSPAVVVTTPASTATAARSCDRHIRQGALDGLTIEVGAGSAKVTWYNAGESTLVKYRLAPVSQDLVFGAQKDPAWVDIVPGERCAAQSYTVTGLNTGETYVFWLDAVTQKFDGGTQDLMIARSTGVTID